MPSSYPAGYDAMNDPAATLSGPPTHSSMHNQINDVLEAIEAELGLNPSGTFATLVARLAAAKCVSVGAGGVALTTSGTTLAVAATLTLPAQGVAGIWLITSVLMWTTTAGTDVYEFTLDDGTTSFAASRSAALSTSYPSTEYLNGRLQHFGTAQTVRLTIARNTGSGAATTVPDPRFNQLNALFTPTSP